MENRGLSGQKIIEELARMAGVSPLSSDPEKARQAAEENRRMEIIEKWWQMLRDALWGPKGGSVLEYLRQRGYSDDLIKKMDVAVHPGRPKNPPPCGLRLPPAEYELLIPARSKNGRIIGFAGRRIDCGEPRYMYSAGLQKSALLWGQHRLCRSADRMIVVEGVMDAESLAAAGIEGVVALGGAQASEEQVKLLTYYSSRIVLALDDDDAGRAGTEKIIKMIYEIARQRLGEEKLVKVYVATDFQGAKDPDELLRRDGPDAVQEAIKKAVSGHKWLVRRMLPASLSGSADQERDAALDRVLDFAKRVHDVDPVASKEVVDEAARVLGLDAAAMSEAVERAAKRRKDRLFNQKLEKIWQAAVAKIKEVSETGEYEYIPQIVSNAQKEIAELCGRNMFIAAADVAALEESLINFPSGLLFPWGVLNTLSRVDRGGLTVVGAATSVGKSTFLYNLMLHWLREEDPDGALILWTGEVVPPLVYARLISIQAGVSMGDVMKQHREQLYTSVVLDAKRELSQLFRDRVYIFDGPVDADVLGSFVKRISEERKITAVLVDYLQQLAPPEKPDGGRYGTREQEVTAVAKLLHELAVEMNIAVVAAAQINRNNYRYAQRPRLTDLRESGAIEQYATAVFGLWNSSMAMAKQGKNESNNEDALPGAPPDAPSDGWYWTPGDEASPEADAAQALAEANGAALLEVNILKNRWRGHVGKTVPLALDGASGRISDLSDFSDVYDLNKYNF